MKIPLYAKHNIPEVWIFETATRAVSLYREPAQNGYRRLPTLKHDETIAPSLLPKVRLRLRHLWLQP